MERSGSLCRVRVETFEVRFFRKISDSDQGHKIFFTNFFIEMPPQKTTSNELTGESC